MGLSPPPKARQVRATRLAWLGSPSSPVAIRLPVDLSSFLVGAACAAACAAYAAALLRARRPSVAPSAPPTADGAHSAAARPEDRTQPFATAVANDVATLASGIEGRMHALVEAAASRAGVPRAAEDLQMAVRRLRALHTRLAALGGKPAIAATSGATDVRRLVARLSAELHSMHVGLELHWDPPEHLPLLHAPHDIVFNALVAACRALLHAEHGASCLTIAAEACYADSKPQLELDCALEWNSDGGGGSSDLLTDPRCALDREAAVALAAACGGTMSFQQLRGRSARAVARWPGLNEAAAEPAAPPQPAASRPREHRYGGALVLETDPAIRAMLASELKATGRAVFVCADATAAAAFLRATPDRFELLLVDRNERLADRELATTLHAIAPELDVFALDEPDIATNASWPRLRHLRKPFGVHELRRALASLVTAS